jgi:hypothetical protein
MSSIPRQIGDWWGLVRPSVMMMVVMIVNLIVEIRVGSNERWGYATAMRCGRLGLGEEVGPGIRAVRVERVETQFGTVELWLWTRRTRREGRSSAVAIAA